MAYNVTIEKDLKQKLDEIRGIKYKEYTILNKKIEEIQNQAPIMKNHRTKFNTFDKPLEDFKWVEINNKILVFKLNPIKQEMHLCDYLSQDEVFEN